jgi:hypothetical protein
VPNTISGWQARLCTLSANAEKPIRVVGFVGERTWVPYPADRKSLPLQEWNLASRRLRNHFLITTIFLMTTDWGEQQPICYASRLVAVPASPAAHEQAEDAIVQFSGPILEDMRRRRRLGRSGWK